MISNTRVDVVIASSALLLALIGSPRLAAQLPQRAFVVTGGSIALEAGVTPDPQQRPLPIGKYRYPTRYLVRVINETEGPVWVDLEWGFPGERPKLQKSSRVESRRAFSSSRSSFGIVSPEPINLRFTVYSDEGRTMTIGSEATFMRFDTLEKRLFLRSFSDNSPPGVMAFLSGWPEMGTFPDSVPGTLADTTLRQGIVLQLWKEESKHHRDCAHEMIRAEQARLDSSAIFAAMLAADSAAAARLLTRMQDTTQTAPALLEHWRVRSCGFTATYEVLLLVSPNGGTDIGVRRVGEEPAGGP